MGMAAMLEEGVMILEGVVKRGGLVVVLRKRGNGVALKRSVF